MKGRDTCKEHPLWFWAQVAVCCAVLGCALVLRLPVSGYSVMTDQNVFRHHDNGKMKIALTFDDGPGGSTSAILDYLKAQDIHATFFTVGCQARTFPELLIRERAEGHEIGNHTDTHPHLADVSIGTLRREILSCEETVCEMTDMRPHLFRPPEGCCNAEISRLVSSLDYRIVLWNIDTRDWADAMAEEIAAGILDNVRSGDIILFHDCVSRKDPQTLAALKRTVPELKRRGYQFVTVSELLGTGA